MGMKKVGISFKDNDEELEIYEFLKRQLSPSVYIKMLLKEKMEEDNESVPVQNKRRGFDF